MPSNDSKNFIFNLFIPIPKPSTIPETIIQNQKVGKKLLDTTRPSKKPESTNAHKLNIFS